MINYFEDSRSFLNKKAYFTLQPRLNTTALGVSVTDLSSNSYTTTQNIQISDILVLDMNVALLSNTMSSGNYEYHLTDRVGSQGLNLFLTNDYLNYFSSSYDNFVISLNTTNASNGNNFSFCYFGNQISSEPPVENNRWKKSEPF